MAIIAQENKVVQEFVDRLPKFPLAGMVWASRHGKDVSPALRHVGRDNIRFFDTVQIATSNRKPFLAVDLDDEAPTPSDDIPLPNLCVVAPTGHAHLIWILDREVFARDGESSAPMRVWEEKQRFLSEALGCDLNYSGFTALNPLYSGFKVATISQQLYKLDDFPNSKGETRKSKAEEVVPRSLLEGVGVGYRNELLFQYVRHKAYSMRGDFDRCEPFFQGVLALSQEANSLFAVALGEREVLATAKSIATWTWEHLAPPKREFYLGGGRTMITDEMRKKAGANPTSQKNLTDRNEAVAKVASERKAVAWRLFTEGKSYKQIAEIIGGSASTARKYIWEAKKSAPAPSAVEVEPLLPGLEA